MRSFPALLLLALAGAAAPAGAAFPDDEVHTEGLAAPGEVGWNLHVTTTPAGRSLPDYPGEIPPAHGWRLVPAVARGLAPGLEAGASVPIAFARRGDAGHAGFKVNVKWMPLEVDADARGAYAGVNVEYAWLPTAIQPVARTLEVRPIVGWRGADWRLAANPILVFDLSGEERGARPALAPAVKLARRVDDGLDAGIEYFGDVGRVGRWLPRAEQAEIVYLTLDVDRAPWSFTVGAGRGVHGPADRWTFKLLADLPF